MTLDPAFQVFLGDCRVRVERALDRWLPPESTRPVRLHSAMRYATLGDGKRVRPVLVYAAGHALGAAPGCLDAAACAVELIHAYSLVHDDLPAMDDDDLRRGKPTVHRRYDEATAILAADALQPLAFQVLAEAPEPPSGPAGQLAAPALSLQRDDAGTPLPGGRELQQGACAAAHGDDGIKGL